MSFSVAGSSGCLLHMKRSFPSFPLMRLYLIPNCLIQRATEGLQNSAELRLHRFYLSRCSLRKSAIFFHAYVIIIKRYGRQVSECAGLLPSVGRSKTLCRVLHNQGTVLIRNRSDLVNLPWCAVEVCYDDEMVLCLLSTLPTGRRIQSLCNHPINSH